MGLYFRIIFFRGDTMSNFKLNKFVNNLWSIFIILMLSSCETHNIIDGKYAASVVKDKLQLDGNVSATKLSGGGSATNFYATDGRKKYVIRFMKKSSHCAQEIYNSKVAANCGYGPQIYFANASQGIVIMEYLSGKSISVLDVIEYCYKKTSSKKYLQSNEFYIALANLLQKIHHGKPFKGCDDYFFREIREKLYTAKLNYENYVSLTKLENLVTIIHEALLPHLAATAPCHNDLHRDNLILCGNKFKAIDFETASQGDPYFDVATVAASFYCKPEDEKILFAAYLGRQPSTTDKAKLYLMKQATWIKWFLDDLLRLSPKYIKQFNHVSAIPLVDLANEIIDGKMDPNKPENNLKILKAQLNHIFDDFESQEFKNAINALKK